MRSLIGRTEPELGASRDRAMDFRTFGIGAQICARSACGACACSARRSSMHALSGFGLEIVEYVVARGCERDDAHG